MATADRGDDGLTRSQVPARAPEGTVTVLVPPEPVVPRDELSTAAPPSTSESSIPQNRSSSPPVDFPVVPGYEILEHLGQGGMGQVFKARATGEERLVALKIVRADRQEETHLVQRFRREAKAGRRLDHPNIVAFYDDIRINDLHFLTMEYVEGSDLAQLMEKNSSFPVDLACNCVRQAALGLQHAHDRGLIHRDIKPSNLVLAKEGGVVKILDMGLARLGANPQAGEAETDLTHSGMMMGTLAYMAPEQAFDARNADGRADIYSLGCTLYHLLAGSPPHRHQMKEPPPLHWSRSEISPVLSAVIRRMMARMPEDRYQAAVDVAKALAPFCPDHVKAKSTPREARADTTATKTWTKRPWVWLAVVAGVALIVLAIAGFARGAPPAPLAPGPPTSPKVIPGEAVELRNLPFADPVLRERFFRTDAIARRLLGPHGAKLPYKNDSPPVFSDQYTRFRMFYDRNKAKKEPKPDLLGGDVYARRIDLVGERNWKVLQGKIHALRLWASWTPDDEAWKAWVFFSYSVSADLPRKTWVGFGLKLNHPKFPPSKLGPLQTIGFPHTRLALAKKYGEFYYAIDVRLDTPKWIGGVANAADVEPLLLRFFTSAKSFREVTLAELDRLEKAVKDGLESGYAILEYTEAKLEYESGLPPKLNFGTPAKMKHPLNSAQRGEILKELLDHINHDRKIINDNFQGMHAAMRKAFPLEELLGESK